MRLIDADALEQHKFISWTMPEFFNEKSLEQQAYQLGWNNAIEAIMENEPTADVVEVKHGRWIKDRLCSTSGGTYGVRRCSVCEYYFQDFINEYNYCPNCGADMRGEDDE